MLAPHRGLHYLFSPCETRLYFARGPKKVEKQDEISILYGKEATLEWDLDRWKWVKGYASLNYTTKLGRDYFINMILGITNAADKWQGYLLSDYKFYWTQVWDPAHSNKEAASMWSILAQGNCGQ